MNGFEGETGSGEVGAAVADRSLKVATALAAELIVVQERMEIIERLAKERGLFGPEDVDAYRPSAELAASLKARRRSFLARVFGALRI